MVTSTIFLILNKSPEHAQQAMRQEHAVHADASVELWQPGRFQESTLGRRMSTSGFGIVLKAVRAFVYDQR